MKKRYFLGLGILFILFISACATQQQEIKPETKVTAPSIKSIVIKDIIGNPNEFVDVEVQVTGRLVFTGKNYFSDPKFAITDGANNFSVGVWAPLEVPPLMPGKEKKSLPLAMNDYVDETITVQGIIKKANGQFYLDVIKVTIIEQQKSEPKLIIVSPKDGELVKGSKIIVELYAEDFKIVPVGDPVKEEEGHFHVWLDSEKRVTTDKLVSFENVVSGKHTIVAELVKSEHSSLSPKVIKMLTINVYSDYIPKLGAQQEGLKEFTVEADDNGFYPDKLKVKIGDKVKLSFKFRDSSIYFAGLDIKGPFPDIKYKLKGEQPLTSEFTMKDETRITSYWPASGVKKAVLVVEVEK